MKISGLSLKPKPGKAPLRSILFDNNGNDDNSSLEALLNRIKYNIQSSIGLSKRELRDLFLPFHLVNVDETTLPVAEVLDILQLDLEASLTLDEQQILCRKYCVKSAPNSKSSNGLFDVEMLLNDMGMWSDDRYQAENVEKAPEKSRGDRGEDENVPLESELNYEIGGSAAAARQKLLEAQRMELARVREEYSPLAQSHNTSRKSNILETAQDTLEKTAASVDDLANLHAQVEAATKLTEAAEEDRVHHRHIASAEENGKVVDSILPNTINLKNKIAELVNEEDVDLASTLKQLEDVAIPPLSPEVPSRLEKILEESSPMPPPKESGPAPWPHENQEPDSQEKPPLGAPQQTKLTANKMAASMTDLELENMRLKHELNSFDEEFFEQLEDLKYKYTELQGIVGEDPMIKKLRAEHKKITSDMDNVGGYRSIDDLPWTRRDPTTIADKSSMTGSLYRRREGIVSEMPPSQATLLRNTGNPLDSGMGGKTISLCEQRLIYAMDELADPLKTIRELCRKIMLVGSASVDTDAEDETLSYISVSELSSLLLKANLYLGQSEVEILASGFASDGRGGVSTMELCQTLFTLLYHVIQQREHDGDDIGDLTKAKPRDRKKPLGKTNTEDDEFLLEQHFTHKSQNEEVESLMQELCDDILCYDKLAIFGTYNISDYNNFNYIVERMLKPFVETEEDEDRRYNGGQPRNNYDSILMDDDPPEVVAIASSCTYPLLKFESFQLAVKEIGGMLSRMDLALCAKYYSLQGNMDAIKPNDSENGMDKAREASAFETTNNLIKNFRNNQHIGGIKGSIQNDPRYNDWLHSEKLRDHDKKDPLNIDPTALKVLYVPFVVRLSEMIRDKLRDYEEDSAKNGTYGGDVNTLRKNIYTNRKRLGKTKAGLPGGLFYAGEEDEDNRNKGQETLLWLSSSDVFDIIDNIIVQLEGLKCGERRRRLLTLQYCFAQADKSQSGDVDGFAVLKALLTAKFSLPKLQRTRILRAVEDLGGTISYIELCQVLMQSCADWTSEERVIISKILRAMGITVSERRNWLTKLRVDLMRGGSSNHAEPKSNKRGSTLGKASTRHAKTPASPPSVIGNTSCTITPIAFLHCLRNNGIMLDIGEEATLLDCLDAEQMAYKLSRMHIKKAILPKTHTEKEVVDRFQQFFGEDTVIDDFSGQNSSGNDAIMANGANKILEEEIIGEPLIYYKSFLALCSRYIGCWQDAAPDVAEAIQRAVIPKPGESIAPNLNAVQEFSALCKAFDDENCGYVGHRAFQIACHRSKLFQHTLEQSEIKTLSDVLSANTAASGTSGGSSDASAATGKRVKYSAFIVYLRGLITNSISNQDSEQDDMVIGKEHSFSDSSPVGQLLANCVDTKTNTLTKLRSWLVKNTDITTCLMTSRDVHAMLREFNVIYRQEHYVEFIHEVGQGIPLPKISIPQSKPTGNGGREPGNDDDELFPVVMDSRLLMIYLLEKRGAWTSIYTPLCNKLYHQLEAAELNNEGTRPASSEGAVTSSGLSAYARKVYKRLRVLADVNTMQTPKAPAILLAPPTRDDSEDMFYSIKGSDMDYNTSQRMAKKRLEEAKTKSEREIALRSYDSLNALSSCLSVDALGICVNKHMFRNVMISMGITLSAKDCELLADATDWHPSGQRVRCNVLLEALRYCSLINSTRGNVVDTLSPRSIAVPKKVEPLTTSSTIGAKTDAASGYTFTESEKYVLEHVHHLLWRTAETSHRTPAQWRADVYSLFKGFDVNRGAAEIAPNGSNTKKTNQVKEANISLSESIENKLSGFITLQDFSIALTLLHASVSGPLLYDLPFLGAEDGTSRPSEADKTNGVGSGPQILVPYLDILAILLVSEGEEKQAEVDSRREKDEKLRQQRMGVDLDHEKKKLGALDTNNEKAMPETRQDHTDIKQSESSLNAQMKHFDPTVGALLYVVRKAPELCDLMHQGKTTSGRGQPVISAEAVEEMQEEAWTTLLKIFQRFDTENTNTVNPRQFCLAVSVLLSDDDIVFTKDDWLHVINFFTVDKESLKKKELMKRTSSSSRFGASSGSTMQLVDYMSFCEMVINPNPIYLKEFRKVQQNTSDNMIHMRKFEQHQKMKKQQIDENDENVLHGRKVGSPRSAKATHGRIGLGSAGTIAEEDGEKLFGRLKSKNLHSNKKLAATGRSGTGSDSRTTTRSRSGNMTTPGRYSGHK